MKKKSICFKKKSLDRQERKKSEK
ncbi:unknown protein [Parachlamydia acanthamoebae UV-7]|uniref:Uncharacterized protein n=1 Tax=Parachlamydia acanthamoebae (strain UV7) TaxID=765952 RepID=F8KZT1_PARAV|nr:unknown protein [Parachlamydia acanthamoebae UV-7]